jgi:hypothetical protein
LFGAGIPSEHVPVGLLFLVEPVACDSISASLGEISFLFGWIVVDGQEGFDDVRVILQIVQYALVKDLL